jgi:hypothetical protein
MSNPNASTNPRMIRAAENRKQAVMMRIGGATYDAIAAHLGMKSRQAVYQLVKNAMRKLAKETTEEVGQLKQIELDRLDAIQAANWGDAMKGDIQKGALILRVMAQRAILLGLNAPVKQELTGKDGDKLGPMVIVFKDDDKDNHAAEVTPEPIVSAGGTEAI